MGQDAGVTINSSPGIRAGQAWTALLAAVLLPINGSASTLAEAAAMNESADTLTGPWWPRVKIEEGGVTPFAVWTTEAWGNVAGGLQRAGWWNSLLDFGVELDTAKLGWWPGGSFMVQAHWAQSLRRDACFEDDTGGFNPVSSIMAGDHLRVFNLYYRHAWHDGAVVLKFGQIAADDDFMGSDHAGLFLNSAFGAMPSQVGTPLATSCGSPPAFPIYSVAAPGVFVHWHPLEAFDTQLGLYYGRPGFDEPSNHGFGWASQSPAELGLFWESGYRYRIAQHPAAVRLGLSHHTGPVDDFSSSPAADLPATRQTVPNFYLIHDLALLMDPDGETRLGLFVRGGVTPEPDGSMVAAYADGGLAWHAPFPSRPDDLAGVAVSYTKFGSDFEQSTGSDGVAAAETTLELTYRAQVSRWLALQADLQLLFNPAVNPDSGSRETATVLGLRAEINF
jgi:porin